ncbi:MAG TPA: FAD-dependent oxidoreductase [Acidimicrobiales bacterium]|jgi:hypothetical protein|nr:FAD-dependent oxidoreductase [Acidimicrobiales bacterium]
MTTANSSDNVTHLRRTGGSAPAPITVVGGGLAGLIASIAAVDAGASSVRLVEAHAGLGGTARSTPGPWIANLGPHALYTTTGLWTWLVDHDLLPPVVTPSTVRARFRWQGRRRVMPPLARQLPRFRQHLASAPVDQSFREWTSSFLPDETVAALWGAAGVLTFDADPGRLSARFVADRFEQIALHAKPVARYVAGGWSALVASLAAAARDRGVLIQTGEHVAELPSSGPVIVGVGAQSAARLLGDDELAPRGTRTALLDVGLRHRWDDPSAVVDLDLAGFATRVTSVLPDLAPDRDELVQLLVGLEPGVALADGVATLEGLLDDTFGGWRDREVWRRRSVVEHRSGALDLPGHTWRDRPAVDRGDDVFVCGDQMAAPGHLAEVSWASALEAAKLAVAASHVRSVAVP